jgi:hypothetical protein
MLSICFVSFYKLFIQFASVHETIWTVIDGGHPDANFAVGNNVVDAPICEVRMVLYFQEF